MTPEQIREALMKQNTELVFTAHPTQAARRSVLSKNGKVSRFLEQQDNSNLLTPVQKNEMLHDLQSTLLTIWRTNPVRRHKPNPEDEARYGLSVVEESIWEVRSKNTPTHQARGIHMYIYAIYMRKRASLLAFMDSLSLPSCCSEGRMWKAVYGARGRMCSNLAVQRCFHLRMHSVTRTADAPRALPLGWLCFEED
jgi:hypothetical protein